MEIKSALMMTATTAVTMEDAVTPANPFVRGSGRIRVDRAIKAGLVMNETTANFQAADPGTGGNPQTLTWRAWATTTASRPASSPAPSATPSPPARCGACKWSACRER